jgi:hypothetical protein
MKAKCFVLDVPRSSEFSERLREIGVMEVHAARFYATERR